MANVPDYDALNDFVAHLPEVAAAVDDLAEKVRAKAEAKLAEHHLTGLMHITVERGRTDVMVWLDDPDGGAVAAEVGRVTANGTVVQPLNIMAQAAQP